MGTKSSSVSAGKKKNHCRIVLLLFINNENLLIFQLFNKVEKQLDPDIRKEDNIDKDEKNKKSDDKDEEENNLPEFNKPKIEYCLLPGDWRYLHVITPGISTPLECQLNNPTDSVSIKKNILL